MGNGSSGTGEIEGGAQGLPAVGGLPFQRAALTLLTGVEVLPLDLASPAGVSHFAGAVTARLGDARTDILVLNAGMQTATTEARGAEGYELTFAVNHLAHYLLARLLVPRMAGHGLTGGTSPGRDSWPAAARS
ncbi:NAD(P)-dependent dehydrogenase (short-subunit alcohol dehydrogenase family) [Nonomuraea rubra]|uniref:NAD(P)-dependent dehydrogenase (Short-subunit alcohol dehydrogenase family) n=1 Tax=Nonomuraea rubra TaxID=46180 RepID=A0A7X0NXS8_9ACTN|nr:hypothetical protein [Nonomuraea rubra]MBB6551346.1 NAD(P)-dependent dehydrogenase (short-subunit alcohol dehydrogenase family) [Nonomuraea rubra]